MTRQERAKQFMPFDAMKGLQAALRDREEHHSRVERRVLSEETIAANSAVLARIDVGSQVRLRYYGNFHEAVRSGAVEELDTSFRFLRLGEEKIYFDDIYEISDMPL
jgi:hypothetical protein